MRVARGGGGAEPRGGALTDALDPLVRPALEAAVVVARAAAVAEPPVKVPSVLRPVLRFTRLNARAFAAARRAVESDEEFRQRVVEVVDEEGIGRPAWLWLARPEGWRDELDIMLEQAEGARQELDATRELARLRRSVAGGEAAARRAEEARQRAEDDAARGREALAAERNARREADRRAAALETEVARLTEEVAAAVGAAREAKGLLEAARGELAEARDVVRRASDPLPPPPPAVPAPTAPGVDVARVAPALDEAASAAAALGAALSEAARSLGAVAGPPVVPPAARGATARPTPRARRPVKKRRPRPLPGGLFEEAPSAADHLVRLPGAVLLVDGYNVSMRAWPGQAIPEQRRRLVDALEELHARTGVEPVVVFDGTAAGGPAPGTGSRSVRIRFTAAEVEADDVVIESVDAFPVDRPVIVASSDQRVRAGARARGANLVTTPQLRSLLRR